MKIYTPLINKAMIIAYDAHRGQKDKSGMPYIYHPAYLAAQMDTEEEIITALLHDIVEDTPITFEDLEREGFSPPVLAALRLLTHGGGVEYMDYIRSIKGDPLATKVKLADLRHNGNPTRNANLSREDTARRLEKYAKAEEMLTESGNDAQL